jgi:large subunit ribosomal protein L25
MDKIELKAEKREISGRKVKKLRSQGLVPANIFGSDVKSLSIQVSQKEFDKVYKKAGETNLVEIVIGKETRPVLIHNVQNDPVSDLMLHVDFLQVNLNKKVSAEVPVELVGESPAEKQAIGTVVQYVDKIEVEALPTEIPDKFEVDLINLAEVDQMFQVKDIKVDANKVKIELDPETIIAKVEPPKEEKEEVAPMVTEGEPVEGAGQEAEGEAAGEEQTKETSEK